MSNSMVLLQKLGISTNSSLTYSEQSNAFLSQGYTSQAGNTYFNTLRLMEGILIKEDVGEGYRYTFLNGIKLYDISKNLLCERSYHCQVYGKSFIAAYSGDADPLSGMLTPSVLPEGTPKVILF